MEMTLNVLNRLVDDGVIGRYAVGGAMGAMFYAEPISTFDLDIFIVLPRLASGLIDEAKIDRLRLDSILRRHSLGPKGQEWLS